VIVEETKDNRTKPLLLLLLPPLGAHINYRLRVSSLTTLSCNPNTLLPIIFLWQNTPSKQAD
jgi:hypothetical protein